MQGGHIDSWDVGQGAMDDGEAAWPRGRPSGRCTRSGSGRTVRVVLWTNEENGLRCANAYRDRYADQLGQYVLAMECGGGVFKPSGFEFCGSDEAYEIVRQVGRLPDRIEAGTINRGLIGAASEASRNSCGWS